MLFKRGHAYVASTVDKGGSHILRQPRVVAIGHFELQPASRVHRSVVFADSLRLSVDGQRASWPESHSKMMMEDR